MSDHICPVCGCRVPEGAGYEEAGNVYCCRHCAEGYAFGCGCEFAESMEEALSD